MQHLHQTTASISLHPNLNQTDPKTTTSCRHKSIQIDTDNGQAILVNLHSPPALIKTAPPRTPQQQLLEVIVIVSEPNQHLQQRNMSPNTILLPSNYIEAIMKKPQALLSAKLLAS